jgi:hypothetical protein
MRRLAVLTTVLAATLAFAATASATITVTTEVNPSQPFVDHYQVLTPYNCAGPNSISLSDPRPVLLKFGWVAQSQSQLTQFFQSEHGTWTITGPGSGNTLTDTWSETAGDPAVGIVAWSPVFATTVTPNGSTSVNAYASAYYGRLTFDTPGTYNFTMAWGFSKTLYDGFGNTVKKGTTYTFACSFTVVP